MPINLTYECRVPEERLLGFGLATPDEWDQPCFACSPFNRLILLDGVVCGAVVTNVDFGTREYGAPVEIVAIKILPAFRGRGIATAIIMSFAVDGIIDVNSPRPNMLGSLSRYAVANELPDSGVIRFEVRKLRPAKTTEQIVEK